MNKLQKILSGFVIAQLILAAVIYYANRPQQKTSQPLLAGYEADKIISVTVQDPDGTQLVFEKQAENWTLPNHGDYPIIDTSLTEVLQAISEINTSRLVASTIVSQNRLQVEKENFVKKLVLEDQQGQQTSLIFGTSPTTSNIHIRIEGDNSVYLTNQINSDQLSTSVSNWISTTYLQLSTANISSISIQNSNGEFLFTQDENSTWATSMELPEGYTFDDTKWNNIRTVLVTVRMTEPIGKEMDEAYGLNSPAAVVTYQVISESGETEQQQLFLGNPTEDGEGVYAKSDTAVYIVKISNYTANQIVEFNIESFTTPPVEETPES